MNTVKQWLFFHFVWILTCISSSKYSKSDTNLTEAEEEEEVEDLEVTDKKTAHQEFIGDDNDPNDWWYAHDDGVKRRVPSTFLFPRVNPAKRVLCTEPFLQQKR